MNKKLIMLLCTVILTTLLLGCTPSQTGQTNLMKDIQANQTQEIPTNKIPLDTILLSATVQPTISDFSVKLFQQSLDEKQNTLVSPLSVLLALAMTANGAEENTLTQMEAVFGAPLDSLNLYLQTYAAQLPQTEKCKLSIANSIWLKTDPDIKVKQDFLQTNADYYNASVYQAPFNAKTLKQINEWVETNTDGMIDKILDEISRDAIMYLINALAFDAEWEEPYTDIQVREDVFTTTDGREQKVDFMYGSEYQYLQDEKARGFIKYYNNRDYAFVALLPDEDVSVAEYVAELNGEKLNSLLSQPQQVEVRTAIPKFESEYSLEMSQLLQKMGMVDAFAPDRADFSGMASWPADTNLYIDKVLHKTYISVDERGTRAGAVTAVAMNKTTAVRPVEFKTVYLDRPFVYMLIDSKNHLPLFIGTVMTVKN